MNFIDTAILALMLWAVIVTCCTLVAVLIQDHRLLHAIARLITRLGEQ